MRLYHFLLNFLSGFWFASLERAPDITICEDDYRLENCALISYSIMDGNCSISCWNNYKSVKEEMHGARLFCIIPPDANWLQEFRTSPKELIIVKGCGEASCDSLFSAPIQGYLLGILSACLSALAGVYTEFLMKKNNDSFYWQNVQLYTFGVIFNMAWLLLDDFRSGFENGAWWQHLLNGYGITTWMVVLNLGSTGLLVSWLMKYADNIVKVYSTSMAMLLTMVLSIYLFSFKPTLQLFLGIIICMMSLHMYFAPPNMLVDLPTTIKAPHPPEGLKEVSIEQRTDS
ncbi:CMP-sialic acid transporter 1 isoform X4 [Manihot esculenta]|uniref:CMP-sialic acid transporter 1 isoform X4 n=1 Tax=Manihot esculenta TaxID=3983 RepID=UPI000B5D5E89|nr:CMP-sialic acid transporter 1 isoform X4 [Manihot esculenta]